VRASERCAGVGRPIGQLASHYMQGAALALGTGSVQCGLLRFGQQVADVRGSGVEMDPAEGEGLMSVAVGEQPEVADLDEASGQDVAQEAADELDRVEGHDAAAVVVSGVSPAEAHLAVVEAEQSPVGDGDAMGVAGQVLQHVFRTAEGRLGVDRPISLAQRTKQGVKCTRLRQRSQRAGKA
jgi:hypothetical protein